MTSVSTHILDTGRGHPAPGVDVTLSVRAGRDGTWTAHGTSATDADGRCKDFPALPGETTHVRLDFAVEAYFDRTREQAEEQTRGSFFPEVTVTFAVVPGEHCHVPLLLSPFGYSVYRGS